MTAAHIDRRACAAQHKAPVRRCRFGENNQLWTGSWDQTLQAWDCRQQNPVSGTQLPAKVFAMDVKNNMLVAGLSDHSIVFYDTRNMSTPFNVCAVPLRRRAPPLTALCTHPCADGEEADPADPGGRRDEQRARLRGGGHREPRCRAPARRGQVRCAAWDRRAPLLTPHGPPQPANFGGAEKGQFRVCRPPHSQGALLRRQRRLLPPRAAVHVRHSGRRRRVLLLVRQGARFMPQQLQQATVRPPSPLLYSFLFV